MPKKVIFRSKMAVVVCETVKLSDRGKAIFRFLNGRSALEFGGVFPRQDGTFFYRFLVLESLPG